MINPALPETLLGLVSHYSPSGAEGAAATWLVERMHTLGYEQAYIDETGNPVGLIGKGPRQIVLMGHIDTVPGELPVRLSEGVLYGRGAVDAKGPLATFVDAAAAAGAAEGWQIAVVGAVEEESSSKGARFAASEFAPEYAIIGEPNHWDRVALGYKGTAWAEINVKQEQTHTASGAASACETAVLYWQAIQQFAAEYNAGRPRAFDQVLPTLREMHSGQDGFTQWARLQVGVRLPLPLSTEDWYARLAAICGEGAVQRLGEAIPAWSCEKNSKVVRALLAAIRGEGGQPAFVYKTGTADLNIVAPAWGCPALVYGPGDSTLDHTPNEKLALDEYLRAVKVLTEALKQLMAR